MDNLFSAEKFCCPRVFSLDEGTWRFGLLTFFLPSAWQRRVENARTIKYLPFPCVQSSFALTCVREEEMHVCLCGQLSEEDLARDLIHAFRFGETHKTMRAKPALLFESYFNILQDGFYASFASSFPLPHVACHRKRDPLGGTQFFLPIGPTRNKFECTFLSSILNP